MRRAQSWQVIPRASRSPRTAVSAPSKLPSGLGGGSRCAPMSIWGVHVGEGVRPDLRALSNPRPRSRAMPKPGAATSAMRPSEMTRSRAPVPRAPAP